MDMESHAGMQSGADMSYILLYVGILLLIVGIIGILSMRKVADYGLKKDQKSTLKKKNKLIKRFSYSLMGVAVVLISIFLILLLAGKYDLKTLNYNASIQVTDDKDYGRGHSDDPVQYELKIPTSGTHSPHDIKFGYYEKKPDNELLVHNLEHGDIIMYFRPTIDAAALDRIKYLTHFRKAGAGILAIPSDDIPEGKEVVVTAWTKTMELQAFNEVAVGTFIYQYIDKGPEAIPTEIRQNGGTM